MSDEKPKILVADDEEAIVSLLQKILNSAGFEVVTAFNGRETLEKVNSENPHLILLDITMPELNGLEVCQQIRQNAEFATLAIVMLTGRDEASSIVKALESGADDYVGKPFDHDALVAKIRTLLERSKVNRLPSQLAAKK